MDEKDKKTEEAEHKADQLTPELPPAKDTEGTEAPAGAPAPSKRDALRDRLRKKYPDKNFDDDEVLAGQIGEDYDATEKELGEYREHERQLGEMLDADPRSAAFLQDWKNGKNPVTSLVDKFGMDFLEYMDDPEHQEELAQAQKEYLDRVANEKKLEDEYQKNLESSLNAIDKAQEENGWDDDYVNNGFKKVFDIVNDAINGKISPETIRLLNDGDSHDDDVAKAGEEGEVRGRNAKITNTLRKGKKGDGTPHLGGGAGSKPRKEGGSSIFDIAAGAR